VSDLRIALLLIAGAVVAGLYVAGKWQERRLLRRLGEQFGGAVVGDALLEQPPAARPGGSPPSGGAQRRIEPQLASEPVESEREHPDDGDEANEPAPAAAARRSDWTEDPLLDCVLELRCARPVDGVSFIDAAVPLISSSQWPLPVSFVVWDGRAQQWVHPDRFGYYTDALAAIQLANRRTFLTQEQIERFAGAVRRTASALGADCDPPDVTRVAANALELDRLCARFDVRVGLTLQASSGGWSEAQVDAAAELAGMQRIEALRWQLVDGSGAIFLVLAMPAAVAETILLELDVPAVSQVEEAAHRLFALSNQLAAQLGARIVDDNARPIDTQSAASIEAQLEALYGEMRAAGIDPGGERARRLYV